MKRQRRIIEDNFFESSQLLRSNFEEAFSSPMEASENRFCWDFWHVEGSYRHLRTAPEMVFPEQVYSSFLDRLQSWGMERLGCSELSPLWLSAYTDGCYQNLHSDMPHGPWAFVYSLSPEDLKGFGGRTKIARDSLTNLWANLGEAKSFHERDFFEFVDPKFNRLLVFDPRLPHAVEAVSHLKDVTHARLVLHGWFLNPQPYVEGGLSPEVVGKGLDDILSMNSELWADYPKLNGLLSFRLYVDASGQISSVDILSNTLLDTSNPLLDTKDLVESIKMSISNYSFSKSETSSKIVFPLVFQ